MRSMTGYGKAVLSNEYFMVSVEIKGVNNRFLDLSVRLPKELSSEEIQVREFLKNKVIRGKIFVYVNVEQSQQNGSELFVDWQAAEKKVKQLNALRERFKLADELKLTHLLMFPELFVMDLESVVEAQIRPLLLGALEKATQEFVQMREQEGANLLQDMRQRMRKIEELVDEIKEIAPQNVKAEFDRLYRNVQSLIEEQNIDRSRMEQELAILTDRVDITEECVRLKSHIGLFNQTVEKDEEIGKRLNFILQEMHREANTINSKTTMLEVSHKVIAIKEEIEKLREQVQNIE
ncbi:YicC/YloC family endoribonuclease [Calditrichota bacterium LG25]